MTLHTSPHNVYVRNYRFSLGSSHGYLPAVNPDSSQFVTKSSGRGSLTAGPCAVGQGVSRLRAPGALARCA